MGLRARQETNDVLYDLAVASKIRHSGSVVNAEPDGGKRTAGFWLGTGNGNTVINSVAVGVEGRQHVSSQTSGFLWPEATGDSIWTFNHNVSHNNGADGIFTWQNAPMPEHRIEDFLGYYNYQGIEHGAYTNRYQYRRLHLYGNVKSGLNVHATSSGINNPLSFGDSIIDGAGLTSYAVYSPAHNANSDIAILFQNNTIRNLAPTGTAFYYDKGTLAEKGTGFRDWWTIRNNVIEGNPNLFWLRGSFSDKDGDALIDYADTNGDGDINALDNGAGQTGGPELFGVGTDTDIYVELTNGEAFRVRSKYFNFPNEAALPLVSAWNARKEAIRPAGTPIVDAGPNRTTFAPANVVALDATVIDPPPGGTLTTTWSKVSGPRHGRSATPHVDTSATFSATGTTSCADATRRNQPRPLRSDDRLLRSRQSVAHRHRDLDRRQWSRLAGPVDRADRQQPACRDQHQPRTHQLQWPPGRTAPSTSTVTTRRTWTSPPSSG